MGITEIYDWTLSFCISFGKGKMARRQDGKTAFNHLAFLPFRLLDH
jgi:hypothetical protein